MGRAYTKPRKAAGEPEPRAGTPGTVVWVSGKYAEVVDDAGAVVQARFHRDTSVVVGDGVRTVVRGDDCWIEARRPRRNTLWRRERGGFGRRAAAADLDRVLIVTAPGVQFRPGLVDRLLVVAAVDAIPATIVLNKCDLAAEAAETEAALGLYERIGVPVLRISARTGQGFNALADLLAGRTTALAGHSGVGKSSIANRLVPDALRAVGDLSDGTGKGVHVTTSARGVPLDGGGMLIDLPGVRILGLTGLAPAEVFAGFPDLAADAPCRFVNCTHGPEPGCAVRAAAAGNADRALRLASYDKLVAEARAVDDAQGWD